MRHFIFTIFLAILMAFHPATSSKAHAETLAPATGDVLLTVSGAITRSNSGDTATFDLALLESLPQITLETETIWTTGAQTFEGVRLKDVLDAAGVSAGTLKAFAINDYAVEIPFEDAEDGSAIIAYRRNGDLMSVREKGPLWVIYPFDQDARFRSEVYYSRSIWQLDRISVAR
jgi:hypothetical protein